jgi:hypothetical protein
MDLKEEVELLREKVQLLERLRALETQIVEQKIIYIQPTPYTPYKITYTADVPWTIWPTVTCQS